MKTYFLWNIEQTKPNLNDGQMTYTMIKVRLRENVDGVFDML